LFFEITDPEILKYDLITNKLDKMVDKKDTPILDSWTESTAEEPWRLGDEVEQSLVINLGFGL
jgi:hypothetical protein